MNERARILITDDEEHVRTSLTSILTRLGYSCMAVSNGEEAIDAMLSDDFDVALIDLKMPQMDGFALLATLSEANIETAPVVLTAYGDLDHAVDAMKLGAVDFLSKPAGAETLQHTIDRAVKHRRNLHQANLMADLAAQWEVTFDASPDMIAVLDTEDRILQCNRAFAEKIGVPKEKLTGRYCHEVLREADHLSELSTIQRLVANRCPSKTEVYSEAWRGHFEIHSIPLEHDPGEVWGCVCIARDITDHKEAEERLRKAHAQNAQLLEAITSILIGVDKEDRVTQWNRVAEHVFGISAETVIGRPFRECGVKWDWEKVLQWIAGTRSKSHPTRSEDIRHTGADEKARILGFTLSPIREENDDPSGFLLLGADITEQKNLESQLSQAQKLESIGQLAAGIAHEINTPTQYVGDNTRFLDDSFADLIKVFRKYSELLSASKVGTVTPELMSEVEAAIEEADVDYLLEEIPKAIQQSLAGVERVARIVRAMKEFSHPGGDEKTGTDINRAIESTVTVARNEWKYVADMVTDFDTGLPLVPCLPGDFNQVILNLVINASHAIADVVGDGAGGKGTITVRTRRDGDWAEIRISDTGTGIPEEFRSRIFDPFFTTKEVGKGTGQGLAISHNVIVEKHKGTLGFETEVGKGTTFIIRLPMEA